VSGVGNGVFLNWRCLCVILEELADFVYAVVCDVKWEWAEPEVAVVASLFPHDGASYGEKYTVSCFT
jgi:hypothetical protein